MLQNEVNSVNSPRVIYYVLNNHSLLKEMMVIKNVENNIS